MSEIANRVSEYDFFVITARMKKNLPKRERIGNAEVLRIGFGYVFLDKILSPFWGAVLTRKLIKEHNVKLFWSLMVTFTSGAPFLLKMFRLNKNIPILLTLQEGDSERHLKFSNLGLTGLAWFFAVRMADRIQVISNYLKDYAVRIGARCAIDVAPNGVDLGKAQAANRKEQIASGKVVITVSRLVHKNGIDVLINAVVKVAKKIPDVQLWILGGGEDEAKLKDLAKKFNIEENVKFFGEIRNEKVYEYLARADVFARPSRSEGLGTSFLEAMAAGLPIIGTPVGGIQDFLRDNETGLFCNVDDPQNLADKILQLLNNGALRREMASQGRNLALQRYSWGRIAGQMKSIFDKMIL